MESFIGVEDIKGETDNLKIDNVDFLKTKLEELYNNPEDASVDFDPINGLLDTFNNNIENGVNVDGEDKVGDELDESVRNKLKEVNKLINDYIDAGNKATIVLSDELGKTLDISNLNFIPNKSGFNRLVSDLKEKGNNFLKDNFMPNTQKALRGDRNEEVLAQLGV